MVTDPTNHLSVERVIPVEQEPNTVSCYKGQEDGLEKGNYRGLKLTDNYLKKFERAIEKLIRQQVNVTEIQFDFKPGCGAREILVSGRLQILLVILRTSHLEVFLGKGVLKICSKFT